MVGDDLEGVRPEMEMYAELKDDDSSDDEV
jgi:hypothetical protein